MRLVFKCLMAVLIVFGVGNYLVYLKTGSLPLMDLRENLRVNWAELGENYAPEQLTQRAKQALGNVNLIQGDQSMSTQVYKWTDAEGQVHYADQPINEGAELINVEPRNALSSPVQADPTIEDEDDETPQTPIEKARAAADAINARTRQQENL